MVSLVCCRLCAGKRWRADPAPLHLHLHFLRHQAVTPLLSQRQTICANGCSKLHTFNTAKGLEELQVIIWPIQIVQCKTHPFLHVRWSTDKNKCLLAALEGTDVFFQHRLVNSSSQSIPIIRRLRESVQEPAFLVRHAFGFKKTDLVSTALFGSSPVPSSPSQRLRRAASSNEPMWKSGIMALADSLSVQCEIADCKGRIKTTHEFS